MERALILLVAALMACVAPGVQATEHLSFASDKQVNITRAGCGDSKLCVETPDDCDPAGNKSCLFASVVTGNSTALNSTDLSIELRGDSEGYIALGLAVNASEGTTMLFACAQNSSDNGTFFFRTMDRNNTDGALTPTEKRVTEIRGMVKGDMIHCEFHVPNVTIPETRRAIIFSILLGKGSVDGSGLGPFNVSLNSGPLDIANPSSNVAPTTVPTTTASSGALHPHAVLVLLSVLTLCVMLRP